MASENSIVKALNLLEYFTVEKPFIGLNELSRLSGYPKANVYRMLCSLEECGFVCRSREYDSDRRYQLGIKLFELGMRVYENLELNKVALPIMKDLKDQINEAVQLVIRDGNSAIYYEKVEPNQPYRLYTAKGRKAPLYAGASGRVLLSGLTDQDIQRILDQPLIKYTDKTPVDKGIILQEIQFVKENKYSISKEELYPNTFEIAVPIFNHNGKVAAALSVAGTTFQITDDKIMYYIAMLNKYGVMISNKLGHNQP